MQAKPSPDTGGGVARGLDRGKATPKHHGRRPPPPHNLAPLSKHLQGITQNINNTVGVSQCCSANLTPLKKQTKGQENIPGALIFSVEKVMDWCNKHSLRKYYSASSRTDEGRPLDDPGQVVATAIRAFPLIPQPACQQTTSPNTCYTGV